jgi:hypothetical protein
VATTISFPAANRINNQQTTGSGGAEGVRGDDRTRDEDIHNNQIDHAEGGVVGDDDDDDDDDGHDDDDNDNNDDGGCGGWDGHRMRKRRGHDDRTNDNQIDHRRGGGRRW